MSQDNSSNAITHLSLAFVKKWRISMLLLIGIMVIGLFTYTSLLKREGMPQIASPFGVVNVPYFVDNKDLINKQITSPIEEAIEEIPEVEKTYSSTDGNFSRIQIRFQQGLTSEEGMDLVEAKIATLDLPQGAEPQYMIFDFGKIDNVHDILFTLVSDNADYKEMQAKGEYIAAALEKNPDIAAADVAEVITEETNPLTGEKIEDVKEISRFGQNENGELKFSKAIYIGVTRKDSEMNILDFSEELRKETDKLMEQKELDGYSIVYSIGDPAVGLKEQVNSLQENIFEALIIVLIAIFFIINWRASIVTVIFIPTVFAATFIAFQMIGYSINYITLFGLVLVLGLFVDDAIVVVEAIDAQKQKGLKGIQAVKRAMTKVGIADTIGTFTTMLVFVPMALISGILGEFIRNMPITVILALGLSLFIALTIIAFLCSVLLRDKPEKKEEESFLGRVDRILHIPGEKVNEFGATWGNFIDAYLAKKRHIVGIIFLSIVLIGVGLFFASKVPFAIFPPAKDTNEMSVSVGFKSGTTLKQAEEVSVAVENDIKKDFGKDIEVVNYFEGNEQTVWMYIQLTDLHERADTSKDIADDMNEIFAKYPDKYTQVASVTAARSGVAEGGEYQYMMQIYAEDYATLKAASADISNFVQNVEYRDGVKVEDAHVENDIDIIKTDGRRMMQIVARLPESENSSGDLQLLTNKVKDYVTDSKVKSLGLEEDAVTYDLGFESEMNESMSSLYLGLMITMVGIYALLVLRFNSFTKPFLVFLGIPFAFPLLFIGLKATETQLGFFVILGFTSLIGIVVNNSIMLMDFAEMRIKEENKNPRDAIVGAIKRRFRPLVATTTITVAGLLPLALNDPFWAPLALSIIFGLISSTTMILICFPAYYYVLESLRNKVWRKNKAALK